MIGGKAVVTSDNPKARPWASMVTAAVRMAGAEPTKAPVQVSIAFHLIRPRGHFGKRGLRPAAPAYPAVKPDLDKLARAALDALTGFVFRDDAQVVRLVVEKVYVERNPGARFVVEEVSA